MNLVDKLPAPDRVSAFSGSCWVARLDHEALDVAVEEAVVVVVGSAQRKEVLEKGPTHLTPNIFGTHSRSNSSLLIGSGESRDTYHPIKIL